jgi:hypothetical protein
MTDTKENGLILAGIIKEGKVGKRSVRARLDLDEKEGRL